MTSDAQQQHTAIHNAPNDAPNHASAHNSTASSLLGNAETRRPHTASPTALTRNYGIDLLRMLSMLFVVLLHLQGHGGVLDSASDINFALAEVLESAAHCAVNCFVLITGYCSCTSKPKSKRIINLWIQALFYSLAIVAFISCYQPDLIGQDTLFAAFRPVISRQWWFFTEYFALFLLMPFLNMIAPRLSVASSRIYIAIVFVTFSFIPWVANADIFRLSGGYSFVWFVLLYLTGCSLRTLRTNGWKPNKGSLLALYGAAVILTALPPIIARADLSQISPFAATIPSLYSYTSPTVFASAIALLLLFEGISIQAKPACKLVAWITPAVFGVYLISDHALMRAAFITNTFAPATQLEPVAMVSILIGCALAIFITCMLIEKLRIALFHILHIDKGIAALGDALDRWILRLVS